MHSNFDFLTAHFPALAKIGGLAEVYLYSDPNTCLYKLGALCETLVGNMFELDNIFVPQENATLSNRIKILKREGMLPREIEDIMFELRRKRNLAVHEDYDSHEDCKTLLRLAHTLTVWFMQTYGDYHYEPEDFTLPQDISDQPKYKSLIAENEALATKLAALAVPADNVTPSERKTRADLTAGKLRPSEAETRMLIDEQLRRVGWEADSVNLRYAKGTRPQKGRNIAIAEWRTDSKVCKYGNADYALFCGLKLMGVIEAKPAHKDISAVIDYQCRDYSRGIRKEDDHYCAGTWGEYKAPFLFATNGRPYLKQLQIKSGIWFRDARSNSNIPKALQGWMSPQGLLELLEKDTAAANTELENTSKDLLRDPDGLNLRPYQIEAIEASERVVINGKSTALLAMATGTGKTRTVLGMIYRFLKSGRFKRVLFLVDRTALGEQAQDVFKEVKLEDLMTLDEIYNVKELEDKEIEKDTKIHVATVQSMVKRILYNEGEAMPSVTDYDLLVIDEAHRGYILDKDMGEDEQLYRNQSDFISKYRMVIEYFDAVKIALTATPALHTAQIFGKPVFEYSYRRAVIEGFLVDHNPPHQLRTKLSTEGITYTKGEQVVIYDPVTGEVENSDELEDELTFEIESFNRRVITENFNRAVLDEIAADINPEGEGKTLIYAVDDNHADLIVKILKEIYEPLGVPNDAVMKITGSVGGGNPKKVLEAVKRYKNERYPSIAVTVDLLTTGMDVPEITTLIFLRRVKSRILFEQMLGRATRLCPAINKSYFDIYDPVGVYESLDPVSTMKPVVQNESATFDDLLEGLETLDSTAKVNNQIDLIIARVQRKKRNLSDDALKHFVDLSGGINPTQMIDKIEHMKSEEAKIYILQNKPLFKILEYGGVCGSRKMIIDSHEDELISHTRGYGDGVSPQDYLDEFRQFIMLNINKIAALNAVCTKPRELTRESLKSLKLELDRGGFTERQLNEAYREITSAEIAADIISFIRRYVISAELLSHEERITCAVKKLRGNHNFNKMQLDWLYRIEKALLSETVLDRELFDSGSFKTAGGYNKLDKIFLGKFDAYMMELNEYLYDDGGKTA